MADVDSTYGFAVGLKPVAIGDKNVTGQLSSVSVPDPAMALLYNPRH
jgi:hypothetical protein